MLVAQLYPTFCGSMDCSLSGFSGIQARYWSGSHFHLQGIFPAQGSYPGLPCCRQILYHLSHEGNSYIVCIIYIMYTLRIFFPLNNLETILNTEFLCAGPAPSDNRTWVVATPRGLMTECKLQSELRLLHFNHHHCN